MIYLILFLALILRVINLNQSLWLDESINVVHARSSDFWWFVTQYPIGDFHPPGWFAILWTWGHIFGFSEIAVRLPSVILGTATVGLTFLLGKELFNRRVGLLASLFLAIAPLHVYYSQEARMYVFAAFSVTLSIYFLNRFILNKKWASLGFMVSLALVLYSDYLAYLIIPAQIIYLVWVRRLGKMALMNFAAVGLAFSPWLSIFFLQLKSGLNTAASLPGWNQVVGGGGLKDLMLVPLKTFFGRVTLVNKTLYLAIAGLVGAIFGSIFIFGLKKFDKSTKLLVCWLFIPLVLAFLVSLFIPILAYFRMIFILPAFYLILGKGIESMRRKIAIAAIVLIGIVSVGSLFGYYSNSRFQREDWRGAVRLVSQNLDNQTLVIFENNEIPAPAKYYSGNLSNFRPGLSENLDNNLVGKNKVFLFEYLVDIYDPQRLVEQKLKDLRFTEINIYDFAGVGFVRAYTRL